MAYFISEENYATPCQANSPADTLAVTILANDIEIRISIIKTKKFFSNLEKTSGVFDKFRADGFEILAADFGNFFHNLLNV